jgi:tetratricopeptide (TPR) repeat protein
MKEALASNAALETAKAICTEGITLGAQGLIEAAIAKYDAVVEQFSLRRKAGFAQVLATALYNKGVALGNLDRNEEAAAAYSVVIKRYGNSTEPMPSLIVAQAMRNKAYRLNALGRGNESIATYEALIAQFGSSIQPDIEATVAPVKAFLAERQAVLDAHEQATRAQSGKTKTARAKSRANPQI